MCGKPSTEYLPRLFEKSSRSERSRSFCGKKSDRKVLWSESLYRLYLYAASSSLSLFVFENENFWTAHNKEVNEIDQGFECDEVEELMVLSASEDLQQLEAWVDNEGDDVAELCLRSLSLIPSEANARKRLKKNNDNPSDLATGNKAN